MTHDPVDNAYEMLRRHTTGEIQFGEHLRAIRYVITHDGRLVAPVMVAMVQTVDVVLFVPDAAEDSLALMVSLEQFDDDAEHGALIDRWQIYHGDPEDVRWAFLDIDAAKLEGLVIDGEALIRTNPLASDESRICRHMNEDHRDDLRILCRHYAQVDVNEPVMVGVDPLGIDVRGRFDVHRIVAPEPMPNADGVRQVLVQMAREAGATS